MCMHTIKAVALTIRRVRQVSGPALFPPRKKRTETDVSDKWTEPVNHRRRHSRKICRVAGARRYGTCVYELALCYLPLQGKQDA